MNSIKIKKKFWSVLEQYCGVRYGLYKKRYYANLIHDKQLHLRNQQIKSDNQSIKVLICLHSFSWGGAEKFAMDTIRYLADKKIEFFVFAEKRTEYFSEFIEHFCLNRLFYAHIYQNSTKQLCEIISLVRPTIIHIHHSYSAYKSLPFLPKKILVVDSLHIIECQGGGYPYLAAIYSRYIDYHHVISLGLGDFLNNTLGVPKFKIIPGYLVDDLQYERKKRKWGDSGICIGFLGRFEKQKRPEIFIEVARCLIKKYSNQKISFIMQGEGSLKSFCYNLIKRYKIEDYFVFLPADKNIYLFHEKIDILLNPAENEGLPLIAIEAAELGTVYIGSDVGQHNEILFNECILTNEPGKFIQQAICIIDRLIIDNSIINDILYTQEFKLKLMKNIPATIKIWSFFYGD